ncbi:MAG: PstS family phosphate ABC transporter substrate-binding protein [Halothece sp.]
MGQKNETLILVPIFVVTLAILSGGIWWLWENFKVNGKDKTARNHTPLETFNTFGEVSPIPSGSFSYLASPSWDSIQEAIDPIIREIHPQFQVRYSGSITQTSQIESEIPKQLSNNQIAFSQVSRPLTQKIGNTTIELDGNSLRQIPIALNVIAIAVNHNLEIPNLTQEQLRDIYTGKIRNWEQVGGPNLEIIPYSQANPKRKTVKFFTEDVLKGESFSSNVEKIDTPIAALKQVSANQGAIYYGLASQVVRDCSVKPLPLQTEEEEVISPYQGSLVSPEECRNTGEPNQLNLEAFQNGDYPLTRPWFIVFQENDGSNEKAGKAYAQLLLTQQGQHLIRNRGLIPVR